MEVDIDQAGAVVLPIDNVAFPDFVKERARRGHSFHPFDRLCVATIGSRRWSRGFRAHAVAAALDNARGFAGTTAQIIELRPPHDPAADHLDRGDPRRIHRKDALDPFAVGDLSQSEVRVHPGVFAPDAHTFEGLDALALALDDAQADAHGIPWLEFRHRPGGGEFLDLLALQFLQKIHNSTSRSVLASCLATWPDAAR